MPPNKELLWIAILYNKFMREPGERGPKLEPITVEMHKLMNDISYIDSVLSIGKEKAKQVAEPVLAKTKEIIGFLS